MIPMSILYASVSLIFIDIYTCYAYVITFTLALHPSWKLEYAKEKWDCAWFNKGVKSLEKAVCFCIVSVHRYLF